jgi:hypothetical protein
VSKELSIHLGIETHPTSKTEILPPSLLIQKIEEMGTNLLSRIEFVSASALLITSQR